MAIRSQHLHIQHIAEGQAPVTETTLSGKTSGRVDSALAARCGVLCLPLLLLVEVGVQLLTPAQPLAQPGMCSDGPTASALPLPVRQDLCSCLYCTESNTNSVDGGVCPCCCYCCCCSQGPLQLSCLTLY
jgi:hypothetical protein